MRTCFSARCVSLAVFLFALAAAPRPAPAGQPDAASIAPTALRCEYLKDPLAIDVPRPRLSWELVAADPSARGLSQTGYQIMVAGSLDDLARDKAGMWDSGRVASAAMSQVEYAGPRLRARQRACWKVRVWDGEGRASAWSAPVEWTAGAASPIDWANAEWIADPTPPPPVERASNGYHSAFTESPDAGGWVAIELKEPAAVDGVRLYPARPYDARPDTPGFLFPVRFRVETATKADFSDATTVLDRGGADVTNPRTEPMLLSFEGTPARFVRLTVIRTAARETKKHAFALAEVQVLAGGKVISLDCAVTAADSIETGPWAAKNLTDGDLRSHALSGYEPLAAPMFRKEFQVPAGGGRVTRATLYISALGVYDALLNGKPVTDHALAPEWTDYTQRVQYQAHDLTQAINPGANCLAVTVGDGWFAGKLGLAQIVPGGPPRAIYGRQPRLIAHLVIDRETGEPQHIITDTTWKTSVDGPTRTADLLDGETHDARKEKPGWDRTGFDDRAWAGASVAQVPPTLRLVAQPNEPVRITRDLTPISITEPRPGAYVFDMGQNMVGWCRITMQGHAGQTVTLRHAEVLNPDGSIYTDNLRGAAQTDRYTFATDGAATFEPRFTYHGFRYVEVTGISETPTPAMLTGRAMNSDCPEAGEFECSDPMVNRLWQNIVWTLRDNLIGVPTDCPQRDERCGWMGDILAFAPTACFAVDMAAFYTKWIPDTRDAQAKDGRFPDFAPHPYDPEARFSGVPAWGDAGVFVPWTAYQFYGDTRMLADHFAAAAKWVEFVHSKNPGLLWKASRGNDYGDWLNADTLKLDNWPKEGAEVPKEVFATMFFYRSTQIVADMARVLGKTDEARKYAALAAEIRDAFAKEYLTAGGELRGNTQAGYALALQFGLIPEAQQQTATARMVERFKPYNGQISTGFHSTLPLMTQLSQRGHNDDAYRLLLNRKMPSWGYEIDHGATTVWERWDGYVEGRGFQNPGMNSFSHYAIGAVGEWMFGTMLGIAPASPGFAEVSIAPRPGPGVDRARASYRSIRGTILSEWKRSDAGLTFDMTIPPNTSALVRLPGRNADAITESGVPLRDSRTVRVLAPSDAIYCRVGSGRYSFLVAP